MIGKIDEKAIPLGLSVGINLNGGSKNKKDGRIRLFCHKFPGVSKGGYALRSRVIWWLYTGEIIYGLDANIHHKNKDRSDDRFENLEKIGHLEHLHKHNPKTVKMIARCCKNCRKIFYIEKWRLKDKSRGTFCSQNCYQNYPKIDTKIKKICAYCKDAFKVQPARATSRKFCSRTCSAKNQWRERHCTF